MSVPVKTLLEPEFSEKFGLELITGQEGLERKIETSRIQKPGLLLTGLLEELHSDRVQIFGAAEIRFLATLEPDKLKKALDVIDKVEIPAIIVTRGLDAPKELVELCAKKGTPLLKASLTSSLLIEGIVKHLDEKLAPTSMLHGVLMDVLGVGLLIIGKSGIGKSECALDLISRGYRLVSDDVVIVRRMPRNILIGTSSDIIRYHIEIRGLGIVNIKDLFGITAIREKKQMDIVIELIKWEMDGEYERLGFEENTYEVLGVKLPFMRVPVSPGRSVASIVEVAARNQILKIMGHHSARNFETELRGAMKAAPKDGAG